MAGGKPSWTRERFAPEARLVRLPQWRYREDGTPEILYEKANVWQRLDPILADALEVLKEGGTFEQGYERALQRETEQLKAHHIRAWLRRFWYELHKSGYIVIPFEEPPPLFHGRYAWMQELGRGGVGVAHLCRDTVEDRLVVVKHAWGYLHRPHETDRSMRKEGEVLRSFSHRAIVAFYDDFEERDLYHLVREFADGPSLSSAFKEAPPDAATRRRLLRQLADMLAHVHERGWLFLDVTPKNFALRDDGSPLAIDLGLCRRHVDGRADLGGLAGSRGYTAPEIIRREGATTATDVFALGCLAAWLATGHTPKHLSNAQERAAAMREQGASEEDVALVARLTADDPAQRPQDMRGVQALL